MTNHKKSRSSKPDPKLLAAARRVRLRARADYSGFKVGAALETAGGEIFSGCNIENASYGLSVCAERVALWTALSKGAKRFRALLVVTAADKAASPCGACRQLLWEYCGNIPVTLVNLQGKHRTHLLGELLPHPFDKASLEKKGG